MDFNWEGQSDAKADFFPSAAFRMRPLHCGNEIENVGNFSREMREVRTIRLSGRC